MRWVVFAWLSNTLFLLDGAEKWMMFCWLGKKSVRNVTVKNNSSTAEGNG